MDDGKVPSRGFSRSQPLTELQQAGIADLFDVKLWDGSHDGLCSFCHTAKERII